MLESHAWKLCVAARDSLRAAVACCVVPVLLLTMVGCGSTMSREDIQGAQQAYEQALELERSGDHAAALTAVEKSLELGGLGPDQLAAAYLLRSRSKANTGDVEGAEVDLEMAEQGSPDLAFFHWTRSVILDKQGKASEAKAAMSLARKNDSAKQLP